MNKRVLMKRLQQIKSIFENILKLDPGNRASAEFSGIAEALAPFGGGDSQKRALRWASRRGN